MISSKNQRGFIRNLSDLTLQIIFNAWWASMNEGSKRPIVWNASRHAPSWRFYLHCAIEESSSPGIICIVCHQVLRHPSEHGTSSMGKHLLANHPIAKLNELTESEVTELTSFDGWWNRFGHFEVARKSRNHNSKFAEQNQIWYPVQSILTEMTDKTFQTGS